MNKENDFFVNCYGNKFGDVYRIQMTEYQITIKKMQILRFFNLKVTTETAHYKLCLQRKQRRDTHRYSTNRPLNQTSKVLRS